MVDNNGTKKDYFDDLVGESGITLEAASRPEEGHTEVLNARFAPGKMALFSLPLDCPPGTTELRLSLTTGPALIEINKAVLQFSNGQNDVALSARSLSETLEILTGGVAIPGDNRSYRLLASDEPVTLKLAGWKSEDSELPTRLDLQLQVQTDPPSAVLLEATILNYFASEHLELQKSGQKLSEAVKQLERYKAELSKISYTPGSDIDFTSTGNSAVFSGEGWSHAEEWGTWTDGERAVVKFRFAAPPKRPLQLRGKALGFVVPEHPRVRVRVNGSDTELARWEFNFAGLQDVSAAVPAILLGEKEFELVFAIIDPASPAELGLSRDSRELGMGLQSLCLY